LSKELASLREHNRYGARGTQYAARVEVYQVSRIWKFGSDVDTDQIVPGRSAPYMTSEAELGRYPFIEARPEFAREVRPGDIIIAGRNFGCGSSR